MPAPLPPGLDRFKQFPTPGPEGLDLSPGLPGGWGMVTGKIEPCISAILVVSVTFLCNLLSHCNSSVCPFGILLYVTHVLTELVLSNNVSP